MGRADSPRTVTTTSLERSFRRHADLLLVMDTVETNAILLLVSITLNQNSGSVVIRDNSHGSRSIGILCHVPSTLLR